MLCLTKPNASPHGIVVRRLLLFLKKRNEQGESVTAELLKGLPGRIAAAQQLRFVYPPHRHPPLAWVCFARWTNELDAVVAEVVDVLDIGVGHTLCSR